MIGGNLELSDASRTLQDGLRKGCFSEVEELREAYGLHLSKVLWKVSSGDEKAGEERPQEEQESL